MSETELLRARNARLVAALEKIMDEVEKHTTEQFSDHIHLIGHKALLDGSGTHEHG